MDETEALAWMVGRGDVLVGVAFAREAIGNLVPLIQGGVLMVHQGSWVTLTPLGALRAGVRVSRGRWVSRRRREKPPRIELSTAAGVPVVLECDLLANRPGLDHWLESFPDDETGPFERTAAIEEIEAKVGKRDLQKRERAILEVFGRRHPCTAPPVQERFPMPVLFLGTTEPWPLEENGSGCPGCHGAELPTSTVCMWCLKSGIDHLLPRVSKPRALKAPEAGKGGLEGKRRAGKKKRKARA